MSKNKQVNNDIDNINEEDIMIKKNKKSLGKILKTSVIIIVLVLIADFAILLMLNKFGQININHHIQDIPLINFFTNTQDTIDQDKILIEKLTSENNDLIQQVKNNESDNVKLIADNDALKKEIQALREQLDKMLAQEEEEYKLADYYSKMKPKAAAEALNSVKANLAIKIFSKMKDGDVGAIMQNMIPEKVAAISKAYDKLNTPSK